MAVTKRNLRNKENKIKRINERRAEIERAVNDHKLPKEYLNQYESAMRSAVHDNSLFSAKGNISHGKRALQEIDTKALDALLKKETSGEAVKKSYQYYKKYYEEQQRLKERSREIYQDDDNPYIQKYEPEGEDTTPYTPEAEDSGYSYEDYLADRDFVYEYMEDDPDWYTALKASFQGVGGKKSYAELRMAYEKWNQMDTQQQREAYQAAVNREQAAYFQ